MDSPLQAGFGKVDYTPDFGVGLAGHGGDFNRRSTGVVAPVYITCVAARLEAVTALVYTIDTCGFRRPHGEAFREAIEAATGVPAGFIIFGATHGHNCPSMAPESEPTVAQTLERMKHAAIEAAKLAIADLSPAELLGAKPVIPGMNFTRHYRLPDGRRTTTNSGMRHDIPIAGHLGPSDPEMVLIKFAREGKPDILIANWQAHPDSGSELGRNQIAASWVGPLRDELEKLSGMSVAYFTGASGNQNKDSKIVEEANNLNWSDYGIKMGQLTYEALGCLKPVTGTGIKTTGQMFTVEIDHSWDHMLNEANEVYDLWKSAGKSAGDALGKTYGFTSSYQARAIRSRAGMSATAELELNAFSICGVGFTTGTYEMFSVHGMYVKEHSPFDIDVIITGNSGYIPTPEAYDYRSYEADTGYYAKGTAEKLAEEYVNMLKTVQ